MVIFSKIKRQSVGPTDGRTDIPARRLADRQTDRQTQVNEIPSSFFPIITYVMSYHLTLQILSQTRENTKLLTPSIRFKNRS